ncbi:hypothetical protein BaRGS_00040261, partial [Batillaria attramentaria]
WGANWGVTPVSDKTILTSALSPTSPAAAVALTSLEQVGNKARAEIDGLRDVTVTRTSTQHTVLTNARNRPRAAAEAQTRANRTILQ